MRLATSTVLRQLLLGCVLAMLCVGCALTESQVQEVKRYAEATAAYKELPGPLLRSYGVRQRNQKLMMVAAKDFTDNPQEREDAWNVLLAARESEVTFDELGQKLDSVLKVLKMYSDVMTALVSDQYTDALGESAVALGKSLDKAADAYNNQYLTTADAKGKLQKVGGVIGQVIRGAGGLYIRVRQAQILKETVEKADPLVEGITDQVKVIAEKMKESFKDYGEEKLKERFKRVARDKGQVDLGSLLLFYDNLLAAKSAEMLADKIAQAATTLRKAHAALKEKTRQREELSELIAAIETLRNEVSAAQDVKKKIEKN